jgi:thermitase
MMRRAAANVVRESYASGGGIHEILLFPASAAMAAARSAFAPVRAATTAEPSMAPRASAMTELTQQIRTNRVLASRFNEARLEGLFVVAPSAAAASEAGPRAVMTLTTDTVVAEALHAKDVRWVADRFGAIVVAEGEEGKVLLRIPDGADGSRRVFEVARALRDRGAGSVQPNFMRIAEHTPRVQTAGAIDPHWAHAKIGVADAWKVTRGSADIRVAILDEGVDARHPALRAAVVLQRDFIGGNGDDAAPDANDAHGTACAGIVASRDAVYPGVAPGVSLMAARIGIGDGANHWIFDDFATADAIDWCWKNGADVLSNSWGGGVPSDVITRAFQRARTLGRNGLGAVVVAAAGNEQGPVGFPGSIGGVLTVGASNEIDERKTRTSHDGENWWGSNFGPTLGLLAPGVHIGTTDILGAAGYAAGDFFDRFNGTSAATPHVAGAAALMLSATPDLTAAQVRDAVMATAVRVSGQGGWNEELGHGRLDVAAAMRAAVGGSPSPTVAATEKSPKRGRGGAGKPASPMKSGRGVGRASGKARTRPKR